MLFIKFPISWIIVLTGLMVCKGALSNSPGTETSTSGNNFLSAPTPPMALSELRNQLESYLKPTTQATRELQAGYQKLRRICDSGRGPTTLKEVLPPDFTSQTSQARLDLVGLEISSQQVLKSYTENSRISRLSACRYMPGFAPLAFACEGFRLDSAKVELAEYANQKLIAEARQRLDLYDQFSGLESRGCTRTGFNMKLWSTDQTYLWPNLMAYPEFLSRVLRTKAPN